MISISYQNPLCCPKISCAGPKSIVLVQMEVQTWTISTQDGCTYTFKENKIYRNRPQPARLLEVFWTNEGRQSVPNKVDVNVINVVMIVALALTGLQTAFSLLWKVCHFILPNCPKLLQSFPLTEINLIVISHRIQFTTYLTFSLTKFSISFRDISGWGKAK